MSFHSTLYDVRVLDSLEAATEQQDVQQTDNPSLLI